MGRTLFLHRDVAARSQHAEPPAQSGRGEATPLRPKTARESYSKARPSAARFGRSGGEVQAQTDRSHEFTCLGGYVPSSEL